VQSKPTPKLEFLARFGLNNPLVRNLLCLLENCNFLHRLLFILWRQ